MKKEIRKTRRPNGDGSLYYSANGYWYFAKRMVINGERKRVKTSAKTKIEAIRKFYEKYGDDNTLSIDDKNNLQINEVLIYWLMNVKRLSVSSSTLCSNLMVYRLYIKPYFENKTLSIINNNTLLVFFNHLLNNKIPKSMFLKTKFVLNQFASYLVLNNYIDSYPLILNNIKYPKSRDEIKYKALPKEIRQDYIKKLNNHQPLKTLCYLGLYAGMRIGEILSLRWKDIDLDKRVIYINSSLTKTYQFNNNGETISNKRKIGTTKTNCSIRAVPIIDELYKTLTEWKVLQLVANGKVKDSLLFDHENDLRSYSGTRRLLKRFNDKYGLSKYDIHFHTFRHTFATMLFEKKINPKIIQLLLGHKSVKTTLEIYNNVSIYNKEMLEIINNVFK